MIRGKLFNTPGVTVNREKVLFPFRKAEALFYYLLVNRQASRDELVNLLWGELVEETAKKNLRNAIYIVNKVVHPEILLSPQKTIVMINPGLPVKTDLDGFLHNRPKALQVYEGPFLKGFSVKGGEEFENWMLQQRAQYQNQYVKMLYDPHSA